MLSFAPVMENLEFENEKFENGELRLWILRLTPPPPEHLDIWLIMCGDYTKY